MELVSCKEIQTVTLRSEDVLWYALRACSVNSWMFSLDSSFRKQSKTTKRHIMQRVSLVGTNSWPCCFASWLRRIHYGKSVMDFPAAWASWPIWGCVMRPSGLRCLMPISIVPRSSTKPSSINWLKSVVFSRLERRSSDSGTSFYRWMQR